MHHEKVTCNNVDDNCSICLIIHYIWHLVFLSILHHVQFVILHTTNYRTIMKDEKLKKAIASLRLLNECLYEKACNDWFSLEANLYAETLILYSRIIKYFGTHE